MSTQNETRRPQMIPRIGNVQALMEIRGTGAKEKITAKFMKTPGPDDLDRDAAHVYDLGEVALLRQLCDNILNDSYRMQTLVIQPAEEPK